MPFQCPDCDKIFAKKGYLQNHKVFHTGEKRYKCDVCDKRFSNSSNRKTHMRIHTGEQPYRCTECDRSFTQASQLTLHKRLHSGERPYICDFCGKGFLNNSCKVRHVRVHTGERPYQCLICGKSFAVASHLSRHTRTHTGEKPYKCGVCDKAFAESAQVDKHIRSHTGDKPYKCDICCKAFAEVSSRNRHVRAHTGIKSHKCMICSKSFSHSWHLNTHVLTHKSEMASLMVDGGVPNTQMPFKGPSGLMHFKGLATLNAQRNLTNLTKVDSIPSIPSTKVDVISPAMIEKAIDACAVMGTFVSEKNPNIESKDAEAAGIAEQKIELDAVCNPDMANMPSTELTNSYVMPTELPPKDFMSYSTCPVQMPSKELQMALDICTNSSVNDICTNSSVNDICTNSSVSDICTNSSVNDICTNSSVTETGVRHFSETEQRKEDGIDIRTDLGNQRMLQDDMEMNTQKDEVYVDAANEMGNKDVECKLNKDAIESGNETEDYDMESEDDAEYTVENGTDVKDEDVDVDNTEIESDETEDYVGSENDAVDKRTACSI